MTETIVVLVEDALTPRDVANLRELHGGDAVRYQVLAPKDAERNLLVSIVDHLALGELREALDEVLGREPSAPRDRRAPEEQVAASVTALRAAGADADGAVVSDDPLPALRSAVAGGGVREVVVVTVPHAVADTFHLDWASRAREELHVPVLHLYLGTDRLG